MAAPIGRWTRAGAAIGGVAGGLFALAVIGFADCSGPHCNRERVLGLLLHLGAGVAIGGGLGLLAACVRRLLQQFAAGR